MTADKTTHVLNHSYDGQLHFATEADFLPHVEKRNLLEQDNVTSHVNWVTEITTVNKRSNILQ